MTCRWVVASGMVGGPEEMSGGDVLVFQEMTDAVAHTQTIRPLTDTAEAGFSGHILNKLGDSGNFTIAVIYFLFFYLNLYHHF